MLMRSFVAEYLGLDINAKAIKSRDEVIPRTPQPVVEIQDLPAVIHEAPLRDVAADLARRAHEELVSRPQLKVAESSCV